jgi:uncharacterized membrane protein YidH (DUF202 family)
MMLRQRTAIALVGFGFAIDAGGIRLTTQNVFAVLKARWRS